MTDPRIQEWLHRLPRNGPWLVSVALGALIAIELARALLMLVGTGQVRWVQPLAVRPGAALLRPGVNVLAITGAHLFGVAAADSGAQDPSNAPLTSANLVLAGTIATNDPKHGVAIISDGGPSKVYSVGDNVSGATLHSVYLDHVVLDRSGTLETLVLPRQLPPSRPLAARVPSGPGPVQNLRSMVEKDPAILSQIMRAVPSYDSAAGKLRGFRIYPARNRNAFNSLGLRPGDLVTAINGAALDDPQRGQEIMNTIETSDRATVTIERGGQMQDLTLNIAQVATEATNELSNAAAGAASAAPAAPFLGAPGNGAGAAPPALAAPFGRMPIGGPRGAGRGLAPGAGVAPTMPAPMPAPMPPVLPTPEPEVAPDTGNN